MESGSGFKVVAHTESYFPIFNIFITALALRNRPFAFPPDSFSMRRGNSHQCALLLNGPHVRTRALVAAHRSSLVTV